MKSICLDFLHRRRLLKSSQRQISKACPCARVCVCCYPKVQRDKRVVWRLHLGETQVNAGDRPELNRARDNPKSAARSGTHKRPPSGIGVFRFSDLVFDLRFFIFAIPHSVSNFDFSCFRVFKFPFDFSFDLFQFLRSIFRVGVFQFLEFPCFWSFETRSCARVSRPANGRHSSV